MHVCVAYMRVRARIIKEIIMLVDMYTDSLSLKFDGDAFTDHHENEHAV